MRHICHHCKQTSVDGNLWCQEIDCPAGRLPSLLEPGTILGQHTIVRQVRVLRSAVIYEGEAQGTHYLLKVANPGDEDYLHQEARALKKLSRANSPYFPVWQDHGAENRADAHGQIVYQGKMLSYVLFDKVAGDFLDDYLLGNPQPWHKHVGWFMLGLAHALRLIHRENGLHLNLNPENILVWHNRSGIPQPLLMDGGIWISAGERWSSTHQRQYEKYFSPAYIAPELLRGDVVTTKSDVFLMGLIMREMLEGQPAITTKLRKNTEIQSDVRAANFTPLSRTDLNTVNTTAGQLENVTEIAQVASAKESGQRYNNADEMYNLLGTIYGKVPDKRPWYRPTSQHAFIAAMAVAIVALVVILMVVLANVSAPTLA